MNKSARPVSAANRTTLASSGIMKITVDFDEMKSNKKKCNSISLATNESVQTGGRGFKMQQQQFADIYKKTTYSKQRQSTLW